MNLECEKKLIELSFFMRRVPFHISICVSIFLYLSFQQLSPFPDEPWFRSFHLISIANVLSLNEAKSSLAQSVSQTIVKRLLSIEVKNSSFYTSRDPFSLRNIIPFSLTQKKKVKEKGKSRKFGRGLNFIDRINAQLFE